MAHEVETMAYAGETPWHGLGVAVTDDLTTDQFLIKAGLNWTVERQPCYTKILGPDGKPIETTIPKQALIRSSDNHILSIISDDWQPVQNQEAFDFFREFVNEGKMTMHTAGSLRNGNMVWALAKVSDGFEIFGDDRVEPHLLFSNPHEYGLAIDIRFTPVRVVCHNTLTLSLQGKGDLGVKANHRRKFDPEMVKKALGIASNKLNDYKSMAEFMGSKRYTPENVIEYFKQVFPAQSTKKDTISRPAATAFNALTTQPGAKYAEGTFWQAFNAVTYVTDHVLGRTQDSRLYSSWYSNNRTRKLNALELAMEYAEAA